MDKINKEKWYMDQAFTYSEAWTCNRRKVWAIIVKDWRLISWWYNGNASWEKECESHNCNDKSTCKSTVHAEANAIINCARIWVSTVWCEMYVTDKPCDNCSRMIINAWISKVYYSRDYHSCGKTIKLEDYIPVKKV